MFFRDDQKLYHSGIIVGLICLKKGEAQRHNGAMTQGQKGAEAQGRKDAKAQRHNWRMAQSCGVT